jgi:hypothetical protein
MFDLPTPDRILDRLSPKNVLNDLGLPTPKDILSSLSNLRGGRGSDSSSSQSPFDIEATINGALNQDIYGSNDRSGGRGGDRGCRRIDCSPAPQVGPRADLPNLYESQGNFAFAHKQMQDALNALRCGNVQEGARGLQAAVGMINQGLGNVRDGVGGDFDLSELPESNPLRRIGSGRQAIRSGRNELQDALDQLSGHCPNIDQAITNIESGIGSFLGGLGNITKSIGLLERGQRDSRPRHVDGRDVREEPQPQIECPPEVQPQPPRAEQERDYDVRGFFGVQRLHQGFFKFSQAMDHMRESIEQATEHDRGDGRREIRRTLDDLKSASVEFRIAFGGNLPGAQHFETANANLWSAFDKLGKGKYGASTTDLRQALDNMTLFQRKVRDNAKD